MTSEIHIFIIWNKGRFKEKEIMSNISKKFVIHDIYEIFWKKEKFSHNLSRFYGERLSDVSSKVKNCGNGPFLLIIVEDRKPNHAERQTLSGKMVVNTNIFDSKIQYRKITGDKQKIHGSSSFKESSYGLALILGKKLDDFLTGTKWDGKIKKFYREPLGSESWNSLEEFFTVLNAGCKYLVLRSFDDLPERYKIGKEGDIDFLVNNKLEAVLISNSKKQGNEDYKNQYCIKIKNDDVYLDFLYVGDGYFDSKWERNMLENRILFKNLFYIPNNLDHFYSLLYHSLIHKKSMSEKYKKKIIKLRDNDNFLKSESSDFDDENQLKSLLEKFLIKNNYYCVRPHDKSIYFNEKIFQNSSLIKEKDLLNNIEKISSNEIIRLSKVAIRILRSEGLRSLVQSVKSKIEHSRNS